MFNKIIFYVLTVALLFILKIEIPSKNYASPTVFNPNISDSQNQKANISTILSAHWSVPASPMVIKPEEIKVTEDNSANWNEYPDLKKKLDNMELPKNIYEYLFKAGYLPDAVILADVNGDGAKDLVIPSNAVGCGACLTENIDIFIGNQRFETSVVRGYVYPRKDGKGFYLTDGAWDGSSSSMSEYTWRNGYFYETARKSMGVK